jgi:hypothetical protein
MKKMGLSEYQQENYVTMFNTAYKGFKMHSQNQGENVHSGAWGAGVFGNSEHVTCTLQALAAQAANVRLIYHGSLNAYNDALNFLTEPSIKNQNYVAIFNVLGDYMQREHPQAELWRPKIKK